jgi:hypothetical protein
MKPVKFSTSKTNNQSIDKTSSNKYNIEKSYKSLTSNLDNMRHQNIKATNVSTNLQSRMGQDGKDGLNGKDGLDGKDGLNGKDGLDGKNGLNGKDGEIGSSGQDGQNGENGEKAVSNYPVTFFSNVENSLVTILYENLKYIKDINIIARGIGEIRLNTDNLLLDSENKINDIINHADSGLFNISHTIDSLNSFQLYKIDVSKSTEDKYVLINVLAYPQTDTVIGISLIQVSYVS